MSAAPGRRRHSRAAARRVAGDADPRRARHAEIEAATVDIGGRRQRVFVNAAESPLARLARRTGRDGRPLIGGHELAAGERLRSDFTRAALMPAVTSRWEPVAGSGRRRRSGARHGTADLLDSAIAARTRVNRALAAVGPEFADILVDVCCFLKGVEEIEQANGWPVRSGKLVLRLALAALARHYGLAGDAGGGAPRGIRHWGAPDYRPKP